MRRATISDVAATAGVSTATVSRVLNGHDVAASTAARVRAAVTALEYIPNALTRGVFAGRTTTIGVVIRDLDSPFYLELIRGIDEVAAAHDSLVVFANTFRRSDREPTQVRAMDGQRVRGLIVTTGETTDEQTRRMAENGTPCVIVARTVENAPPNLHSVSLDDTEAGRLIAAHLLACGRTAVGVVCASTRPSQTGRVTGLRDTLSTAGVTLPAHAVRIAATAADVPDAVTGLLGAAEAHGRPLDAVVCMTGWLTVHVYGALRGSGRDVPGDIAFLAMDDFPWAATLGITVVTQPARQMGRRSAELITGGTGGPSRLIMTPHLIARRSCGEHATDTTR